MARFLRLKNLSPTAPLRWRALLISLAFTLASAAPLAAQGVSTAGLRGRVLDHEGAPVEAALVTLEHTETGATNTAITTADGRYSLRSLRPGGPYTMTITLIGFADHTREDIELLLGRFVNLDVTLLPEAVAIEGIEVEVQRDIEFDPGRIGISTLVTAEIIEELPTLSRNFVDFAALSPLVRVSEEGVSIAGANFRFNTLNVDGALNQDVFGLSTENVAGGRAGGRVIPLDAVEQFQVLVAPFDVRQSGFTGGAMNAVTKSGTNDFETSAFGYYRSEALVGELVVDDVATVPELSTAHGGFTIGGPLRRDRAHFFVAGEWERVREPPSGFHLGESDEFRLSLVPDSVARMTSLLEGFGADPGTAESFTLENTVFNLFARFDWEMGERHDAMLRYSFASADDDPDPNRLPGDVYELSSSGSEIRSRSHSGVFQLFSSFAGGVSNEFAANLQHLDDTETARSAFPQVEVTIDGTVGGSRVRRDLRSGANYFSQDNGLKQFVVQLSNNLSYDVGRHSLLFGASGTWFNFDRQYVPGALGSYHFESLQDLALNRPERYEITIPLTEDGSSARFGVSEYSLYAQDEWAVSERFTVRGGVRIDIPTFQEQPSWNRRLYSEFGIDTAELPSRNSTVSLRGGFNWRPFEGTQLRAGTGVFTGRPAYAWLANAFQNTGDAVRTLVCRDFAAPDLDPGQPAPTECAFGPGEESQPVINYFDPDFRFPQDLRTMVALDQRMPGGLVLSGSLLYNIVLNQIFIQNDNLVAEFSEGGEYQGFTNGYGFGVREVFGTSTGGTGRGQEQLWQGGRRSDQFGPILQVTNRDDNLTFAATFELRKDFGETLGLRAGYSVTRSADIQNLTSIDVTSNYASTPVNLHPNRPIRQRSSFDRPHKVVASAHARIPPRFGGTEISVLYVGQSGVPYSYVYKGDINGDGFPGPRASSLSNDLLFVPDVAGRLPGGSFANLVMWSGLYELEDCLQEQKNRILARNTCNTPWSNQVDLRISQNIAARGVSAQLTLDLLNILNLLDSSQGIVHVVNPVVQTFEVRRVLLDALDNPADPPTELTSSYIGGTQRDRETGRLRAALPYVAAVPTSQWRAQFGVRLRLER